MNKFFASSAMALVLSTSPAFADGHTMSWSGFHLGLNAGYIGSKTQFDQSIIPFVGIDPVSFSNRSSGFIGGVQAGYDWQSGSIVFGVEADIQASSAGFSNTTPQTMMGIPTMQSVSQTNDLHALNTVRARVGMPVENALIYVTGGLALGLIEYSASTDLGGGIPLNYSDTRWQSGWTAGAGVEYAINESWSIKGEYLYYDLNNHSAIATPSMPVGFSSSNEWSNNGHIVRAGLNYHIGGSADSDLALSSTAAFADGGTMSWTGFHVGLNAGYIGSKTQFDQSLLGPFGLDPISDSNRSSGFIGGVQAGYDWQSDTFVFGVEADIQASNANEAATIPLSIMGIPLPPPFAATYTSELKALGTVRARLGMPVDKALVYVTGGLAMGLIEYSSSNTGFGGFPSSYADTRWQPGWTAGAGVEYAINESWSVKGEYLYYDLQDHSAFSDASIPGAFTDSNGWSNTGHIVRAGLNYHVGSSADGALALSSTSAFSDSGTMSWTGFHVGLNAGYVGSKTQLDLTIPAFFGFDPISASITSSSFIGGAQAGYDWQTSAIVLGVEADIQASNASETNTSPLSIMGMPLPAPFLATYSSKLKALGTVRARVGMPVDNALIYVTGGLALGNVENSASVNAGGGGFVYNSMNDTWQPGWTAGAGLEYAINDSWSIKGEYLYYDLQDQSTAGVTSMAGFGTTSEEWSNTGHIVRAGFNYRFGE